MTLRDIINIRQDKYSSFKRGILFGGFWAGYCQGWSHAYRDLAEILEQNGFDMDIIVTEKEYEDND